jgi:hypothetical protein
MTRDYEDFDDDYREIMQFRNQFYNEVKTKRLGQTKEKEPKEISIMSSYEWLWDKDSTSVYELLAYLKEKSADRRALETVDPNALTDIGALIWDEEGEFAAGDGTAESPYIILTATQFSNVRNHLGSHFQLKKDIELWRAFAEGEYEAIGAGTFDGVWSAEQGFHGVFDGGNYTISGSLELSSLASGLFASVAKEGIIKNLRCDVSAKTTGNDVNNTMGGLVGYNAGTIENCTLEDSRVTGTGKYATVGGIVGTNAGVVRGCVSAGEITAEGEYAKAGGVVGLNLPTGKVINCRSKAEVTSEYRAGAVVGLNEGEETGSKTFGSLKT